MTLFFDTKVQFLDPEAVSTISAWHKVESVFAVASYSQNRGGSVTVFDEQGEPLRDVTYPVHPISQATALAWHPEKTVLVSGWENGEVFAWAKGRREFFAVKGLHKAPIVSLAFSEQGGRLVCADAMGVLTGWRSDSQNQFLTVFTLELKDPVLHITFRRTLKTENSELTNLAKAAVAGDESALDTLTNWRPKTAARNNTQFIGVKDNHCFYVGTQSGVLYYVNQHGSCTEVLQLPTSPIIQFLWHPHKDAAVAMLDDMTVLHFLVDSSGALAELDRVKLSGRIPGQNGFMTWTYGSALAIIVGDLSVRIWDIETSDNFLLPLEVATSEEVKVAKAPKSNSGIEIFTCLAYSSVGHTICAGTSYGNLYSWHRGSSYDEDNHGEFGGVIQWHLKNKTNIRGSIKHCTWGLCDLVTPCILLNCITNVFVMKEQPIIIFHGPGVSALQKTAYSVQLEKFQEKQLIRCVVQSEVTITDLAANEKYLVLTNGKQIITFNLVVTENATVKGSEGSLTVKQINNFAMANQKLLLHDDRVIILSGETVKIVSVTGGVALQELTFKSREGPPIGIDLNKYFLTIFTMNGFVRLYDLSRHEPRLITPPSGIMRTGYDLFDNFGEFMMIKSSSSGTHLCMLIATESLLPDGKLYVYSVEQDQLTFFDFFNEKEGGARVAENFFTKLPVNFFWDRVDNRMLATEVKCIQQKATKGQTKTRVVSESRVLVMFVTEKAKFNELEEITLGPGEQLASFNVPEVVLLKVNKTINITLRDFKGLESEDPHTIKMVLDFSLNVAQGNMDQAFKNQTIQSQAVWENLAKMCVSTRRLDVAKVCLGHLKRASSARALRLAMQDKSLEEDAKVAVLAIELNMIEEAIELYKKCKRYDLLNQLYQDMGKFEEAVKIAEQFDQVHLKSTYYKYGEWMKEVGDHKMAMELFKKSGSTTANISQLLVDDPTGVQKTMENTKDKKLLNWWAQYLESTGDLEGALKVYQKAEDCFSHVRLLCFMGQLPKANSLATQTGDRAACYHLARHYENIGRVSEAIGFYAKAETFGNAVRICKEHHLAEDLWLVAGKAQGRDKISAAAYFEEQGEFKKSVELYHSAGLLHKALEMAFASKQPEILQVIAGELDPKSDIELVNRCVDFFLEVGQNHKAVQLLSNTRQFKRALAVCAEKGVPITESSAEALTPEKDEIPEEERLEILWKLGEILQEQGDYHTATKKFTQAGDKVRAMKSLLKSGDKEKIIYFATMSRQSEVYVMAANYLQTLRWSQDPKIMKSIVTFYTKGHAFELLANFYATVAQAEIEDNRSYENALNALGEAGRSLEKKMTNHKAADQLQGTMEEVRKMIQLERSFKAGEFPSVINGCKNFLVMNNPKLIVKTSDVIELLFRSLMATKQFPEALNQLKELTRHSHDWSSRGLIEEHLIHELAEEMNVSFEDLWSAGDGRYRKHFSNNRGDQDVEEEIEERLE